MPCRTAINAVFSKSEGECALIKILELYFPVGQKIDIAAATAFVRKTNFFLHPDKNSDPRAEDAFKKFNNTWERLMDRMKAGTFSMPSGPFP